MQIGKFFFPGKEAVFSDAKNPREFMGNNIPMLMNSIPTIRTSPCKNG